jgi:uncharacterized cupredoxin-like copper-binding protein
MTIKAHRLTATIAVGAALLAASGFALACGGGSKDKAAGATVAPTNDAAANDAAATLAAGNPKEREDESAIAVSVTEWKITAADGGALTSIKGGEVKFSVKDEGKQQHEFVVIRSDADPASFPVKAGAIDEEAAGQSPGEADDISPGETKSATMRLAAGTYVYLCNLPGHYQLGMHGRLTVQ